eukprot:TRINITY_DN57193_c0_g1_i1.p1 TRINITY_DN57193_c0_g1~~TRINITY_DN57193_c0_g1_i1.p1  ORF type:complete len:344 (-),score=72.85 TRINITY_DN57193_c0_g1_i1:55-1032(-)
MADEKQVVAEEPSEETATPEERLAWLRARGVIVEEPADRRPKVPVSRGRPKFTYVRIPVDENEDCEELSGETDDCDALPQLLAPRFASGDVSDEALLACAASAGQTIGLDHLRTVLARGGSECFTLAPGTDENGREGVKAYLDEVAALKNLPRNNRASTLVQQCGYPASAELRGEIFVGRLKWGNGGVVTNVDFHLPELDAKSPWVLRAPTENLRLQAATNPEEHSKAQAGASADKPAEGEGEGYSWQDQGEEVEIRVSVESGTSKRDVQVDFRRREVRVTRPVRLELKLHAPVELDGCTWTVGDGQIVLTLEKASAAPWPQLLE